VIYVKGDRNLKRYNVTIICDYNKQFSTNTNVYNTNTKQTLLCLNLTPVGSADSTVSN